MSLKSLLKEAKHLIEKKDFENAREQCNYILELDNKNYTAYTFLGLTEFNLKNTTNCIEAYKNAIKINTELPMPYQVKYL